MPACYQYSSSRPRGCSATGPCGPGRGTEVAAKVLRDRDSGSARTSLRAPDSVHVIPHRRMFNPMNSKIAAAVLQTIPAEQGRFRSHQGQSAILGSVARPTRYVTKKAAHSAEQTGILWVGLATWGCWMILLFGRRAWRTNGGEGPAARRRLKEGRRMSQCWQLTWCDRRADALPRGSRQTRAFSRYLLCPSGG